MSRRNAGKSKRSCRIVEWWLDRRLARQLQWLDRVKYPRHGESEWR